MYARTAPPTQSTMLIGPIRSALSRRGTCLEPLADRFLDERRIRLATRLLHDRADKEPDRGLAGPIVGDGARIGLDDAIDDRAQRVHIRDLVKATGLHDRGHGRATHEVFGQDLFRIGPRDLTGDDPMEEVRELRGLGLANEPRRGAGRVLLAGP